MYQLTNNPGSILRSDGTIIPTDHNNHDYQDYQAWLTAGNTPQPAPTESLDELKTTATLKIDGDADNIRRAVLGERATEYQTAYSEASAFKNAGYTGTVPPTVQSWVDAKAAGGVTWIAQQAADDILATAAQWTSAQYSIRANRLKAKEQAKAATDAVGVNAALAAWSAFVAGIKTQLGV